MYQHYIFIAEYYSIVWIYHIYLSIHQVICFCFFALMKNAKLTKRPLSAHQATEQEYSTPMVKLSAERLYVKNKHCVR